MTTSFVNIVFGPPKVENGVVVVPFRINLTDDIAEGPVDEVITASNGFALTLQTIAKGRDAIRDCVEECFEERRHDWGAITFNRYRDAMVEHLTTLDLSRFAAPQWASAHPQHPRVQ
ncbi:hypothetical protein KEU06_09530 [Pseudaminobacter sp. 19-2017]|uniref:Uncharacterized protein n=1 Tax=Pseudaminobacter soli (ex Zhang et al. 2022) TaxID=2831468 RepID=A0A942I926_9HYPH|nr:hypothetical protein [Pseudaminobacter soli]MBS3648846.1 hypothetical protein [Pseudaminobacter soli]